MNWKSSLALFALLTATLSHAGPVLSPAAAREKLKAGALLVDVRSPEEFKEKHLPGAVNVPVDTVTTGITNHVTDKGRVLLLHCRSGRRSGIAEQELTAAGYTNVFNLGSYEQAEKVAGPTRD